MLASQKTEFQEEVLMLLRNIVAKLRVLTEKIEKVDSAAKSLGMACGQAFLQVKTRGRTTGNADGPLGIRRYDRSRHIFLIKLSQRFRGGFFEPLRRTRPLFVR